MYDAAAYRDNEAISGTAEGDDAHSTPIAAHAPAA